MSDLISRQAVLDLVNSDWKYEGLESDILDLPSVQPTNKGEWIPMFDRWGDIVTTVCGYECSACGEWNADADKFCPNCGSQMERGESE